MVREEGKNSFSVLFSENAITTEDKGESVAALMGTTASTDIVAGTADVTTKKVTLANGKQGDIAILSDFTADHAEEETEETTPEN